MTGFGALVSAGAFSGARGSVGDRVAETLEEEAPVLGVAWRLLIVPGVAGYPDRKRGVLLIAFRV